MDERNAIGFGCLGLVVVVAWMWLATIDEYAMALALGSTMSFLCGS